MRLKSSKALTQWVEFKGISGRELARRADLSQAIVGHLMSGRRRTCKIGTARAIEKVLEVPEGFFFDAEMSRVVDAPRPRVKVPA